MPQNLAIYPELDRIRRADPNVYVLIRISPYRTTEQVVTDMVNMRDALLAQFNYDGEVVRLQITNEGRKIYARKVVE